MEYGALTAEQRQVYARTRTTSHEWRMEVLDLDHRLQGDLTPAALAGQVDFNRDADAPRASGTLDLIDDDGTVLDLDLRHLVRITHGLWVPEFADTVWTPVITARPMIPEDKGEVVGLALHGKDSFGLREGHPRRTWGKHRYVASVIRDMHEDIGESKFRVDPSLLTGKAPKLAGKVQTGGPNQEQCPTLVSRRLASAHGIEAEYDAEGYLCIRRPAKAPAARWSDDPDDPDFGGLLSTMTWRRDLTVIRNHVVATGKPTGKGKSRRKRQRTATAPPGHIYSPQSLKRGGVPDRITAYLNLPSVASLAELQRRADAQLARLLTEHPVAQMQVIPRYDLSHGALVEASRITGKAGQWRLQDASLPITSTGEDVSMSIGYRTDLKVAL